MPADHEVVSGPTTTSSAAANAGIPAALVTNRFDPSRALPNRGDSGRSHSNACESNAPAPGNRPRGVFARRREHRYDPGATAWTLAPPIPQGGGDHRPLLPAGEKVPEGRMRGRAAAASGGVSRGRPRYSRRHESRGEDRVKRTDRHAFPGPPGRCEAGGARSRPGARVATDPEIDTSAGADAFL